MQPNYTKFLLHASIYLTYNFRVQFTNCFISLQIPCSRWQLFESMVILEYVHFKIFKIAKGWNDTNWLQKDIGKWTIYGGGGYWINPGTGNKNWEFSGILVQYNFTDTFFIGAELFHQTPSSIYSNDNTGLHLGCGIPLIKNYQILISSDLGNGITSYKHFSYYLGLYHTF